jgi:hypothetical protein
MYKTIPTLIAAFVFIAVVSMPLTAKAVSLTNNSQSAHLNFYGGWEDTCCLNFSITVVQNFVKSTDIQTTRESVAFGFAYYYDETRGQALWFETDWENLPSIRFTIASRNPSRITASGLIPGAWWTWTETDGLIKVAEDVLEFQVGAEALIDTQYNRVSETKKTETMLNILIEKFDGASSPAVIEDGSYIISSFVGRVEAANYGEIFDDRQHSVLVTHNIH